VYQWEEDESANALDTNGAMRFVGLKAYLGSRFDPWCKGSPTAIIH